MIEGMLSLLTLTRNFNFVGVCNYIITIIEPVRIYFLRETIHHHQKIKKRKINPSIFIEK